MSKQNVTRTFKPRKLPNDNYAFENTLCHSKLDFNGKEKIFIKINDFCCYPSVALSAIELGTIGISGIIRNKFGISLVETIKVTEINISDNTISDITFNISFIGKNKNISSFHEAEIMDKIKKIFNNYYFSNGQILLMSANDRNFILSVTAPNNGYLSSETKITLVSDDVSINLIGSKLLKRDLFKDNYNFEEIGIGGLNGELTNTFRRALSTRAIKSSIAEKLGIKHVKGILLYGVPGTGKTLIARKIGAMITNKEPKIVNGPEIMDKFVGESERKIRELFSDAKGDQDTNGDNSELHVIIFDEIDAICKMRGRSGSQSSAHDGVVNQLLSMIDGVHQLNNIFIIAMTNRKDMLDEALLRAGRIEVHIEIGLPSKEGREQIFRIHTNKMKINNMMGNVNVEDLATMTENYSGAEIESVVKNASARAVHEQLQSDKKEIDDSDIIVKNRHFVDAINEINPSFGNNNKEIKLLIPDKYVHMTPNHELSYDNIMTLLGQNKKLKKILICGEESGSGKTVLAAKIAFDKKIKYTKIIRAIDIISCDENAKNYHIADAVTNAYLSEDSLVVIDDIEIAINYAKIGNNLTFSNKLYQTLITILKTEPTTPDHKLSLMMTCSDENLVEIIAKHFDMVCYLKKH